MQTNTQPPILQTNTQPPILQTNAQPPIMQQGKGGVGQFLKNYLKQSLEIVKHPLKLLPTIVLGAIWIVLGWFTSKIKLSLPLEVVSFLTFTQGGLFGGVIGAVGGILGKVVVAAFLNAAILPLFEKKPPFSGIHGSMRHIVDSMKLRSTSALAPLYFGLGTALLLYGFMNIAQSGKNAMVGLVSAVLLIQSIGNRGGFVWGLLFSIANSKTKGKVPQFASITRFLLGMSLGFTLGAGLSLVGLHWCFWLAIPMLILGFIFSLFKKKVSNSM